jgi:hypothetical protein
MDEITVKPGRGMSVVVCHPGAELLLELAAPDDNYARIDLICLSGNEVMAVFGTPMPPPLRAPECPDEAEVLAGVLVKPLYVASSDIIAPEKLAES